MHECLLCKRDMKKSKNIFGNGCINNIYKFLKLEKPNKSKSNEKELYNNIMEKTGHAGLSKNQKIWLTDRYLTYKYLEKLKYGNFDKIKEQVNKDIENINKANSFDELESANNVELKESYDLYKIQVKFDKLIKKIKNITEDINEFKVLVASFSFIFNLYRNKKQYKKDMSKAMQYAFWQTVIEVGSKFVGFDISAYFLQHSLEENPETLIITEGKIVDEIKTDKNFLDKINEIVEKQKENKKFCLDNDSIVLKDSDLYFSINKAKLVIEGNKYGNKWYFNIILHDIYDYTDFKNIKDYYKDTESIIKSIFSSTLYNFAYLSVKFGVIKVYEIYVKFKLENYEV